MYQKKMHLHFIGIGGIGMSGIAKILKHQEYIISGCDLDCEQQTVHDLQAMGCEISNGHNSQLCNSTDIDVIVYSSAVAKTSPEVVAAQQRGVPTIPRALMLAELMRTKYSIAISGSHGKTTTTSLVGHILLEAKLDPTVIVGGRVKNLSTNAHHGSGEFLIAEADESDRSLLYLPATIGVITNIDLEHLETYSDIDDIKQTYIHFLNNLPFYGKAILCSDNEHIQSILPMPHLRTTTYGLYSNAHIRAQNIILEPTRSHFDVWQHETLLGNVTLNLAGEHNISNSLAAIAIAEELEIPFEVTAQALSTFGGVERRFTFMKHWHGADVFDDYAHHPNEIIPTLKVARARAENRLIAVFQPHRYTRTKALWHQFISAFMTSELDELIITDIYPASETPIEGITSGKLTKELQALNPSFPVTYLPYEKDFSSIKQTLEHIVKPGDLVLLLGAGALNRMPKNM